MESKDKLPCMMVSFEFLMEENLNGIVLVIDTTTDIQCWDLNNFSLYVI